MRLRLQRGLLLPSLVVGLGGLVAPVAARRPAPALSTNNNNGANAAAKDPKADEAEEGEQRPHFEPVDNRWFAPGNPVQLRDGTLLDIPEYEINERASFWNSYRQHRLKGDFPIFGDDVFLNMTVTSRSIFEPRKVPTRTGITGPVGQVRPEFFGRSNQGFFNQDLAFARTRQIHFGYG